MLTRSETFRTWWAARNVWLRRTGVKHLMQGWQAQPPRQRLASVVAAGQQQLDMSPAMT